jgi:type II secretory pathway component GspD/PulD (secretin)
MMDALRSLPLPVWGWALLVLLPGEAAARQPPARAADQTETHVFRLKYITATEAARILRDILGSDIGPKGSLRLSVDERTNAVIVAGEPGKTIRVAAILQRIDVEGTPRPPQKAEPAAADLRVRVYWLASNPDRKQSPGLGGDLRDVAAELTKLGIDRIRLAAQVTASPGARFEMSGTAQLDSPYRLAASGSVLDRKGSVVADLAVNVALAPPTREPRPVAGLRTRVTVPLGRPVVLGITPTETAASAFVVLVTRAEPSRQAAVKAEKAFAFEFRDMPWKRVLEWLSDQTGLPVVAQVKPTGTFSFLPPAGRRYTIPQIIDVLNEALANQANQKFLLIRRPNSLVLVPADERIDPALATSVRPDELDSHGKTEWVAMTIPLAGVQAEEAAPDVRKLLGPFGDVQVLKTANRLEVRDTAENLRRVYQLIRELEKGGK